MVSCLKPDGAYNCKTKNCNFFQGGSQGGITPGNIELRLTISNYLKGQINKYKLMTYAWCGLSGLEGKIPNSVVSTAIKYINSKYQNMIC